MKSYKAKPLFIEGLCYTYSRMSSIKDFIEKIKAYMGQIKDKMYSKEKGLKISSDLYIVLIILLVSLASYGLGILSSYEKHKTPISITKTKDNLYASVLESTKDTKTGELNIVASKSGTKYYYTWCSGVSRIKEENKIYFKTTEEARARGLTPASGCVGLK